MKTVDVERNPSFLERPLSSIFLWIVSQVYIFFFICHLFSKKLEKQFDVYKQASVIREVPEFFDTQKMREFIIFPFAGMSKISHLLGKIGLTLKKTTSGCYTHSPYVSAILIFCR